MDRPPVTYLCPTYGRVEDLRRALSCFLLQTYPDRRLLILNDAPQLLRLHESVRRALNDIQADISIVNMPLSETKNIGHKRNLLLDLASTELVAHFDDDDILLPPHLEVMVSEFSSRDGTEMLIPSRGLKFIGTRRVRRLSDRKYHDAMVFSRSKALELGGYDDVEFAEDVYLRRKFARQNLVSYYGGQPLLLRRSGRKNQLTNLKDRDRFLEINQDFGEGDLQPAPLIGYRTVIRDKKPGALTAWLDLWLKVFALTEADRWWEDLAGVQDEIRRIRLQHGSPDDE